MIYCYPVIKGKKRRDWFYSEWSEVPIESFCAWTRLAKKLQPIEERLKVDYAKIVDLSNDQAILMYKEHHASADKLKRKIKKIRKDLAPIEKEYNVLICEMISLFTSVPSEVIVDMKVGGEDFDDNHIQSYKNRLDLLVSNPLPIDSISEFKFQTKTDEEIDLLEKRYNALSWLGKRSNKGRDLKKQLRAAKQGTYRIKDVWLQSTMANRYFQEKANEIIEQMESGVYDGLPFLCALITTEGQQDDQAMEEIRNNKNNQAYLEKYNAEFLKVFKYRLKVFTEQKEKLSIGILKKIANFFLSNYKI